jgi:hypothetical protein
MTPPVLLRQRHKDGSSLLRVPWRGRMGVHQSGAARRLGRPTGPDPEHGDPPHAAHSAARERSDLAGV